ncbi:unnamed protein product [Somion occarium]|uniref:N-acetyltransferase domain-containing protein n=1 Tax=Somion occarium TaxID=3059160 RepID=A0ABP1DTP5_9APHY
MPIVYQPVPPSDIEAAYAIEIAGFPSEEAASLQAFQYRQREAPDLFLGAYLTEGDTRTLVGYVCSTLSPSPSLTHESMSTHVPSSPSVCIHSICVSATHRRKRIAVGLLKAYISRLEQAHIDGAPYERILLITHEELRPLYEKAGFEFVGPSAVVHGSRPWFEMRRVLEASSSVSSPPSQALPPGIWEALQRASTSRNRPVARRLSSLPNGLDDVSELATDTSVSVNKVDLLCPRDGCGSIILKNGVATLVEKESVQLEPPERQNPLLHPLPTPGAPLLKWWRVTPNAMAFENIGFSKPVGSQVSPNGKKLQLLLCAECDLGPLGWCEEGGTEFWLASNRVGYRQ